jgi:hypothetical protein
VAAASRDRGPERHLGTGCSPFERLERRLRGGGREQHRVPGLGGKGADPVGEQRPQRSRYGQRGLRVRGQDPVTQRAGDLERVQRVAARRGFDPDEREAREGSAEPGLEQVVESGQGQRPHLEPLDPVGGDRRDEAARTIVVTARQWAACRVVVGRGAQRDDQPDRPVEEPSDRVREHRRRARVQPLRVVHGEDDRAVGREGAEGPGDRDRECPLVGRRSHRRDAEQRDLERVALGIGESGEERLIDAAEEVGEPAQGEVALCPPGSRPQHVAPGGHGARNGLLPERRLADARLAGEDERREAGSRAVEEPHDRGELDCPADDLVRHPDLPAPAVPPAPPPWTGLAPEADPGTVHQRSRICRNRWEREPPSGSNARPTSV